MNMNIWSKDTISDKEKWNITKNSSDIYKTNEELSETLTYIEKLIDNCKEINYHNVIDYNYFWENDEEIKKNIDIFINEQWNKYYQYDIIVDENKDSISETLKAKIPNRISRFAFDRDSCRGIRYYIFESKWDYKLSIWFYWWSTGRWNDICLKNISDKYKDNKNVKKIDLKFSEILHYLNW